MKIVCTDCGKLLSKKEAISRVESAGFSAHEYFYCKKCWKETRKIEEEREKSIFPLLIILSVFSFFIIVTFLIWYFNINLGFGELYVG